MDLKHFNINNEFFKLCDSLTKLENTIFEDRNSHFPGISSYTEFIKLREKIISDRIKLLYLLVSIRENEKNDSL